MRADLNRDPVNRAALHWLQEVKDINPSYLHVLSLAFWGLERGVEGEWPASHRSALEEQLGQLLGWKQENALAWLLANPQGPSGPEQRASLLRLIKEASSPRRASAAILSEIYSHQVAENPQIQPAASESI